MATNTDISFFRGEDITLNVTITGTNIAGWNLAFSVAKAYGQTRAFTKITGDTGTANVAVTTTDISLTDTREAWTIDSWIGAIVTCNGKTMTVTDNTETMLTGLAWSGGGNPGNGNSWTLTGAGIDITEAGTGKFDVAIIDTDTDSLDTGSYVWDIKRTDAGQEVVLAYGNLELKPKVAA